MQSNIRKWKGKRRKILETGRNIITMEVSSKRICGMFSSWEANNFSAAGEILRSFRNPKFLYHAHKSFVGKFCNYFASFSFVLNVLLTNLSLHYLKVPLHCKWDIALLGPYSAFIGSQLPTFRGNLSHLQASSLTASPLKMGPICFPETSVTDYHSTMRNVPEVRRSHMESSSVRDFKYPPPRRW